LNLRIPGSIPTSPDTFPVPLSAVASYTLAGGSGAIRHVDQDLVVTINGDVAEGHNQQEVQAKVKEYIEKTELPGMTLRVAGSNDEQVAAQEFLSRAFLIALFLILLVLILQFDRVQVPLIILGSVVMSLIGVLWGLIITGTPFGIMMTGIGVISLAGVVVNNAIVLLTYVQQLMEKGDSVHEALVKAGVARLRPVMLTAVTTILGLVPMALGISFDFTRLKWMIGTQSAQWWGPMAVAVIFGLAVATVLTLVMVPTMYAVADDWHRLSIRGWFKQRLQRRRLPDAPAGGVGK
jgi:multidrug efflux pump subunit AcrB